MRTQNLKGKPETVEFEAVELFLVGGAAASEVASSLQPDHVYLTMVSERGGHFILQFKKAEQLADVMVALLEMAESCGWKMPRKKE